MAKTVIINGVTYQDVNSVKLPLATDTTKQVVFVETSDATAAEDGSQHAKGTTAYINGKKVTGTHTDPVLSLANGVLTIA